MILIGCGIALFIVAYVIHSDPNDVYGFALDKFLMEFGAYALILFGVFHLWISLKRWGNASPETTGDSKPVGAPRSGSAHRVHRIWFFVGMFALTVILYCVGINSLIFQSEVSRIPNPGLNFIPADLPVGLLHTLTIGMGLWWPLSGMIVFFAFLSAKHGDEWAATAFWLVLGFPVGAAFAGLLSYLPAQ